MSSLYSLLGIGILLLIVIEGGKYIFWKYIIGEVEDKNEDLYEVRKAGTDNRLFGEYENQIYQKTYLMTKREALFFRKLSEILKNKDYIICPKVRLEDVIGVNSYNGYRPWKVSGQLDRSHIDFVLIGKTDLKTKFAIELDDTTHLSYWARKKDKIKNEAFKHAHIPLIRFDDPNITEGDFDRKGFKL